jgi:hypothetical protein
MNEMDATEKSGTVQMTSKSSKEKRPRRSAYTISLGPSSDACSTAWYVPVECQHVASHDASVVVLAMSCTIYNTSGHDMVRPQSLERHDMHDSGDNILRKRGSDNRPE